MPNSPALKTVNYLLAAVFVFFAWFQRNDIDPAIYYHPSVIDSTLWFLFYLVIGVIFLTLNFRIIPKWYFIVAVIACLIEMGLSGPGLWNNLTGKETFTMTQTSMSAEDPRVELTREFFGALLALAAVGFQFWQNKRQRASA